MRLRLLVSAIGLGTMLSFSVARADEQSELDKGRNAFLARKYDDADARFRAMLDPQSGTLRDPILISQARMYWAAVLLAQNRLEEATAQFEKLLLSDLQFEPDPLSFPTDAINAFIDTRARMRSRLNDEARRLAKLEADRKRQEDEERQKHLAHIALLEKMATEEKIVENHSRFIASVPFGAGQFQNGHRSLGWVFLATEAAFLTVGLVTVPIFLNEYNNQQEAYADRRIGDAELYLNRANTVRYVNLGAYAAFALTAAIGIVEAHVNYVPTTQKIKKRTLPTLSSLSPFAAPHASSGGVVGVRGQF